MKAGDIIRFRYTGASAEVLEDYLDGSFAVWLFDDEEESIAFRDDIVLDKDFKGIEQSPFTKTNNKSSYKKKSTEEMFFSEEELSKRKKKTSLKKSQHEEIKQEERKKQAVFVPIEFRETTPTDSGLWVAFVEQMSNSYTIYLVNDTNYSLQFDFQLFQEKNQVHQLKHRIPPYQYFPIGEIPHIMLGHRPKILLTCPSLKIEASLKLKYDKWIKLPTDTPLMGLYCPAKMLISYQQITNAQLKRENLSGSDLKEYTKEKITHQLKTEIDTRYYNKEDAQRLAHFNHELDLHIEKLVDHASDLLPADIFQLQQLALDRYMQQAIELEVTEVFIIHGLGEGKLQRTVANYLKNLKRQRLIREFKNEYLPKYGFGATHVRI